MQPGRNDPCPCGSGRRYKHCCGSTAAPAPAPIPAAATGQDIGALVALVGRGALAEAEERTRRLLEAQPEAGMLWKVLSVAQLRQGKNALPALERAAELLPQDAEAHVNLGAELNARGQWEAALAKLRQALQLEPRNADALVEAANAQRNLGRPGEALKLYAWALQADPRRADAHHNLGAALLDAGRPADAVRSYREAVALAPDHPLMLAGLANALRQDGQIEAALECSRRALAIDAHQPLAHNNAGVILSARGQRVAAIGHFRTALAVNPRYVEAYLNLGQALWDEGLRREALGAYEQAAALVPGRADAQYAVGHALLQLRRAPEAAERFRAVLRLEPAHLHAQLGLAAALRVLGQQDEAEAQARAATRREPASAPALALLGELRADRGEFGEARQYFSQALAADPKCAMAYAGLAAHGRMSAADREWLRGAQALVESGVAPADELPVRYALGKYFDDVGDYEQAFASYRAANELARRMYPRYERAALEELVARMIARCDGDFLARAHAGASDSDRPVLIIGMPRSGTSLTEQILASHPQVAGAGEVRFWERVLGPAAGWEGQGAQAEALRRQLTAGYLERLGAPAAAAHVIDKLPGNFLYAGAIHALFPRARFIHMQRHPLDTCVSVYFQNFFNATPFAHDLADLAHYYEHYLRLMAHWRAVLPAGTLLEVPYEGLVADAEGWTRRMLQFMGLEFDARCLEFHRTQRVVITASKWQVRQEISAGSIGRWRHYAKHLAALRPLLQQAPPQAS